MNKKELIIHVLEKMGYKPEIDDDGDIMVMYQMKSIFILTSDGDDKYVSVVLPRFHEMVEGEEVIEMATCNKLTRELKLVKVYVDQTFKNITATCDFFFVNEESLEYSLAQSMELLGVVRSVFRKEKKELSES